MFFETKRFYRINRVYTFYWYLAYMTHSPGLSRHIPTDLNINCPQGKRAHKFYFACVHNNDRFFF